MSSHYLETLFQPSSIAVIGASNRSHSVGMKIFKNLIDGGYQGQLFAVNPKHKTIQAHPSFANINDIPEEIDLAVIATPANIIPKIITECGKKGVRQAIIISSGFSETGEDGKALEQHILNVAKGYHIRLIGPNCLGVMRPAFKMNATFDHAFALPGNLALISQSGALSSGILDWAYAKKIGFSAIVSLGNSVDIDFADILDYLTVDPATQSILLYIEGIRNARHFMSALRAAARMKPVIVIKAGRHPNAVRAAMSHTGAMIGEDDVFDVALKRAGAVRVMTIEALFLAAEILSTNHRVDGNRLMIITNGGGAGVLAADQASDLHIVLPALSAEAKDQLNDVLPMQWSQQNPIDIIGDATASRYHQALSICANIPNIDAILIILVPVAMVEPLQVAELMAKTANEMNLFIMACWMGEKRVKSSWDFFAKKHISCFDTPDKAIQAFSYLADYQQNQQLLLQVPEPLSPQPKPDSVTAKAIIASALKEKRYILTVFESKIILKAFSIPVSETLEAETKEKAVKAALKLGFPVVMKINSPDIVHKQDVNGVSLNIANSEAVENTFERLINDAKSACPDANILGVTIESMIKTPNDRELMIGVMRDPVFGPVISFGAGGLLVEIMKDRVLALPPLNQFIAKQLIEQTRIAKLLGKFRNMPAVNVDTIINILLRVSEMVCELPEIDELDINPLIINEKNAIAVDARIVIRKDQASLTPYHHMAIHPYPMDLMTSYHLADDTPILIRPIRPEDATMTQSFVRNLSSQSKYFRFLQHMRELSPHMLARLTQIDYDREMTFIATIKQVGEETAIGLAHYVTNQDKESCEFALVVADAWQNKGVGAKLITTLLKQAKSQSLTCVIGLVLATNAPMLKLTERLGFVISDSEDSTVKIITQYI